MEEILNYVICSAKDLDKNARFVAAKRVAMEEAIKRAAQLPEWIGLSPGGLVPEPKKYVRTNTLSEYWQAVNGTALNEFPEITPPDITAYHDVFNTTVDKDVILVLYGLMVTPAIRGYAVGVTPGAYFVEDIVLSKLSVKIDNVTYAKMGTVEMKSMGGGTAAIIFDQPFIAQSDSTITVRAKYDAVTPKLTVTPLCYTFIKSTTKAVGETIITP